MLAYSSSTITVTSRRSPLRSWTASHSTISMRCGRSERRRTIGGGARAHASGPATSPYSWCCACRMAAKRSGTMSCRDLRRSLPDPQWDGSPPQIPVSMPSLFRFDASAVVHTCSSSHRTPAPLTARRHPQRSPPRLLTDAACGGLESPPPRRPRRTYLHHWHSTDRADDLLHHHHHFPSGHTWVPIIRSWALTRDYALHPGTRNRYEIRDTRTQHRPPSWQVNDHGRVFGTHTTGDGLQRGQFCWPPLGRTVGRQRAATWPPLGRISWPPTNLFSRRR